MYNQIFTANILQLLDKRNMTQTELSARASVSNSFISDLLAGKGNPSLKIMKKIADALEMPLPMMLEISDRDLRSLNILTDVKFFQGLPEGFERVYAVVPSHRAFVIRKWDKEARIKLRDLL